jgi:uncharacterized protein
LETIDELNALALQGDVDAEYSRGCLYEQDQGVAQDYAEAVFWFHKAAEQGHTAAQNNLGTMYSMGQTVSRDDAAVKNGCSKLQNKAM